MPVLVALLADDQGLASAHGHTLHPARSFFPTGPPQMRKLPDVMHFAVHRRPAEFAVFRQQPLHQCAAQAIVPLGRPVMNHGTFLPP
jgi:hypothetical protein